MAVWALGRLRDDGARDALATMLRTMHPARTESGTYAQGEGAVRLLSDAEGRLFDAAVQALGRLAQGENDAVVRRALVEARRRVADEELDRPARLPPPELSADSAPPTLRSLFDTAMAVFVEDETGC